MGGNQPHPEGLGDDFFEQILAVPSYSAAAGGGAAAAAAAAAADGSSSMGLGLGPGPGPVPGDGSGHMGGGFRGVSGSGSGSGLGLPFGLNLEHGGSSCGFFKAEADSDALGLAASSSASRLNQQENEAVNLTNLFPAFGQLQSHPFRPNPPPLQLHQQFQGQPAPTHGPAPTVSHPPTIRPRVRARRGQATDPHSIAERLRRERIAERMKALQELVPSCNKADRAAMLDEIVDYVKFLRLQVKVLSMSRIGGAGAVAQLVADVPPSSVEREGVESGQAAWEKWSGDGTEQQVAKLMEQDIGAAMQFLQSKALCIMPISLASTIFRSPLPPSDGPSVVKPESNPLP